MRAISLIESEHVCSRNILHALQICFQYTSLSRTPPQLMLQSGIQREVIVLDFLSTAGLQLAFAFYPMPAWCQADLNLAVHDLKTLDNQAAMQLGLL